MTTLALCMITKNEENFVQQAIMSVKPLVDEIIVVDTGSTDHTKEAAKSLGAKVFEIEWEDDFSKAKNFAVQKAQSNWILFLDADEYISPEDAGKIKEIIKGKENIENTENKKHVAFSFISRHYTKAPQQQAGWKALKEEDKKDPFKEFAGFYDVKYITRLFRKDKNIFFQGAVHEDVNPSIIEWDKKEGDKKIIVLEIPIHHLHAAKEGSFIDDKQKQYFDLSKDKIKTNPDAKTYMDLAVGYAFFENNVDESINNYFNAVRLQGILEDNEKQIKKLIKEKNKIGAVVEITKLLDLKKHDINSIMNLAKTYYKIKQYGKALAVLKKLHSSNPRDLAVLEMMGICYTNAKLFKDAIAVFTLATKIVPKNPLFYFNLGAVYEKTKQYRSAVNAFNWAIKFGHPQAEELKKRIAVLNGMIGGGASYTIKVGDKEIN